MGINTKSEASIEGRASDSIFGGVSIITTSWSFFKVLDSYCAPHKLAVLKVKLSFAILFSDLIINHFPRLPCGSVSITATLKL